MNSLSNKASSFLKTTFSSLQYRNFRLFYFGQCISLTGTWMQRTAQTWLVYTLTKSPLMVSIVGVCQFMPMLLFSLFAGVIVDRFDKKKLLILTQAVFMMQAAIMTMLTFTGTIRYYHIFILSAVYGLTQTLDMPARQSFFIELVGRENVMNAISLNSTIVNLARIVGPAVSGLIMLKFGIVFCFFVNAISFIPVIIGIVLIKAPKNTPHIVGRHMLTDIVEGLRYIAKNETLVLDALIMAVVCTFAMNNDVIIPVFADKVLGQGANGYTSLLTMSGLGAFAAAIFMAYRSKGGVHKKLLILGGIITALLQILTLVSRNYYFCASIIVVIGFSNLAFLNTANSTFQTTSADEYRGRVMGVYSFLNQGSTPLGNFYAGSVMEHVGGDSGFVSCGAATILLLTVICFSKRRTVIQWFKNK